MNKLSDKQKRFCKEYVIDLNATQAAIRAGYSENTARSIANQLLTKLNIQNYISELKDKIGNKLEVTAEMIADEFRKIAFSSIAHMHNSWLDRKEFDELTDDQKACIESIKTRTRKFFDKDQGQMVEVEEIQIKLYSKISALENLGKHLGFYEQDNKQKSPVLNFGSEDEQL
jgi:phage terminase small subunit